MTMARAVGAVLLVGACASGSGNQVTVSAAASLTDVFREIATAFEASNPGIDVVVNHAGSATLRDQILEGAPVDVFAAADPALVADLVAAGAAGGEGRIFATTGLVAVVPPDNPGGVAAAADFARPELLIGLCAEQVPCGMLARRALAAAGVEPSVDTDELNVRALLAKVEAGELDAGVVYATDARVAEVQALDLFDGSGVTAEYSIVVLVDAPNPEAAAAFLDFVMGPRGTEILDGFGFSVP